MTFKKAIRTLELNKILDKLKYFASANITKDYIDEIEISTDYEEINKRLKETSEAVSLIVKKGEPPLFSIISLRDVLRRASLGGILNPSNLIDISNFLRVSRLLKNYLKKDDKDENTENISIIKDLIDNLYINRNLEDSINKKIISEDQVADDASRKLLSIRRNIVKLQGSLREKLEKILQSQKDYLQDSIITMREGRYVIPVRNENKSKVKGLVHDISGSGQTVYIEPIEVVNANNEIKTLKIEEKEEVEKILKELSEEVAEVSTSIESNELILREIDFIFAKGKLSLDMGANLPKVNKNRYIDLKNAYHPLLNRKIAVPINIYIGKDFTSLIITGPNTGGKTVTLKTLGILQLMAQYGLHIPADEDSQVGIFNNLFADIGDEQSIEQNLSTFSSHMTNIVEILEKVDEDSLVLFDELGAGTDPTEGAALARSIMDFMLERKIRCISTTHYNQLKIYALTTEWVKNASMEFDINTLSPTYKLLIGLPGKSNAFEISKRLGLSQKIINHARDLISQENIEFEKVLASIEKDRTKTREFKELAKRHKSDLEKQNARLENELKKIENSKEKILKEAKDEARRILLSTKENVDLILDEISSLKAEISSDQARRIQESGDLLRNSIRKVDNDKKFVIEKAKKPIEDIKVGDQVRNSFGNISTVLELPDSKGNIYIQSGIMKMKVPKESLTRIDPVDEVSKTKTRNIIKSKTMDVKSQIDLRGKNFEDSRDLVDKYLDDAFLAGLKTVNLIHGKGTGVLRKKLREYLKKQKNVKSYSDAPYNEGGDGVTRVILK